LDGRGCGLFRVGRRCGTRTGKAGLSQDELAQLVGTTRRTISSLEHGQSSPSVALALALANALDATVEELFADGGLR
jgi:putative transcriptional regulator